MINLALLLRVDQDCKKPTASHKQIAMGKTVDARTDTDALQTTSDRQKRVRPFYQSSAMPERIPTLPLKSTSCVPDRTVGQATTAA